MQSAQFQLHAEIEERHWWFTGRRSILRRLAGELLPAGSEHAVLDVGCGTGANLAALSDDYRCVGIDTSAEAIELERGRFPQIKFVCGYAPTDVREELSSVRLILATDVLEHVERDRELLTSLYEAAAPGTQFLLTVPADMTLWSQHDESFGHYRRYDAQQFAALWEGLPVRQRLLTYFNKRLYPAVKFVRTLSRWRGGSAGTSGTDFRIPATWTNKLLEKVFSGEGTALVEMLHGRRRAFTRGVSLLAVLEKT